MHLSDAIGITTTIPVEILFAAGRTPIDLNNCFIADPDASEWVMQAEQEGFPQSACAWIKGLYATVKQKDIREVIGVVEGDCSDTGGLLEILESEGINIHAFGFPHTRTHADLLREMERLAAIFGVTLEQADACKQELDAVRTLARDIDTLAYTSDVITSQELFDSLLLLSDFGGDPAACNETLAAFLTTAQARVATSEPSRKELRLMCVGVPTIFSDLWDAFEDCGARFVDHEVPRQFARIDAIGASLAESYLSYTYPYDMAGRVKDIAVQTATRRVDGIVHYVQSFCHRQIHDRLLREGTHLPVLTIEGDRPGAVDERTRTRIEAFCEQLAARR